MSDLKNFIPKEATQQSEFLKKYPEYDGRGIKIAIIDSDVVDINLPGMQKTTTGLPKIIECIGKLEITVDTSTIVELKGKDFIIGTNGRKLKIPTKFKNPSDKWHFGCTSFERIYEKFFKCKENENFEENDFSNTNKSFPLNDEICDCIVWFDGTKWQACIYTSSNPDDLKILTNFEDEYEVAYLPNELPYGINICDEGNLLQILCPPNDHATLVTHVAAAYFPDNPESNNGLAPGAQIISFRWRDLEADLLKCIELKVDILNLSFTFPFTPTILKTVKKMVEEHGIIITQCATNLGPFYSSIPEKYHEFSNYFLLIGAIFPEEMRKGPRRYSQSRNSVWIYSSKGPLLSSGARGIDFVAPGDAITDLPKWYPNKNERCHGTSFAAPNAAGAVACLLSALKANGISYSPALVKMALANTAFLPKGADKLAFGNGIIQIDKAFEFIKKSINISPLKSLIPISIDHPKQTGILCYQNKFKLPQEYRYYVNSNPTLDTKWALKLSQNGNKFISHHKTDNFFIVKIDTNSLEEGSINYAEIYGYDSTNPSSHNPLFYLPITVIFPADSFNNKRITLNPGPPIHFFFTIPSESQKCCIKITSVENKEEMNIALEHCQKKKDSSCWCALHENVLGYHNFKLTSKENTKTLLVDIEKDDEKLFEICIFSLDYSTSKFMLDIHFQKTAL